MILFAPLFCQISNYLINYWQYLIKVMLADPGKFWNIEYKF